MGFRTVVISSRCKLEYSLNHMICRNDKVTRICLDEINMVIVQSLEVAITTALIYQLNQKKIKVMFCDNCSNPNSELVPYYGAYNTFEKINRQLSITNDVKSSLWKQIVKQKIKEQSINLYYAGKLEERMKLVDYLENVEDDDVSNREAHAAKVYFNSLFGKEFSRSVDCLINVYLNYGYSILLSAINREIKAQGYLTEIGFHHKGVENYFNLSCDFIEPLRPLVDFYVISNKLNKDNYKKVLVDMLNLKVKYANQNIYLINAIHNYVLDVMQKAILGDISDLDFIIYERL